MPAYNEEANIENTIAEWYTVVEQSGKDCRLVVANDGSHDHTYEIMLRLKDKYPQFIPLNKPNEGHGPTIIYLYRYAIDNDADYIFQTDSDRQTLPDEFPLFLSSIKNFDCIMGNRKIRGDGTIRKIVENVLRAYLLLFFHVWIPDANAPFRLMKTSVVAKYLPFLPADFNLPNAVLSACFSKFNEKVSYREITFKPRQGGKNSINPKQIFKIGWKAISDFWHISCIINKIT